jgi:hypothetical protein
MRERREVRFHRSAGCPCVCALRSPLARVVTAAHSDHNVLLVRAHLTDR